MDKQVVELCGVTRVYGSRGTAVRALNNVDVAFAAGSWTALMGPSGSGKSTLLHCAAGLERVTNGRVILNGQDLTKASDAELTRLRRSVVGFVFQSFNLIGSLSAEHNVGMPLRLAGRRPSRRQVREVLAAVGAVATSSSTRSPATGSARGEATRPRTPSRDRPPTRRG
jgi:putative ABC transport system ATP-binding protein